MKDRTLLMIPGPIEFEPAVLQALGAPTTSHVSPDFIGVFGQAIERMRDVWRAPSGQPFIVAGSGTLGMDIAGTPAQDLKDCGYLVRFLQGVQLQGMAPRDELAHAGTDYVLAKPGDRYVAYAADAAGQIGLKDMTAGRYRFDWCDCASGKRVLQTSVTVAEGDSAWKAPAGFGREVAVYLRRLDD